MSKQFSMAIKIDFDKEITNNPDKPIEITPLVNKLTVATPINSTVYSTSSTYRLLNAFDGSTGTYWRPLAGWPQWIGADFAIPTLITKIRLYCSSTSYAPKDCVIQRSDDGVEWVDVLAVALPQVGTWQDITFEPATSRYWRLLVNTAWSSYIRIYELEFYSGRMAYDTSGWEVIGQEPYSVPGEPQPTSYEIYRITKTPDNLSVILWLKSSGRMRYPQGEVMVRFFGDLRGQGNVSVEAFNKSFTPIGLTHIFNPNAVERVTVESVVPVANLTSVFYYENSTPTERVELTAVAVTASLIDVINLP